jgi:hypothetical protein
MTSKVRTIKRIREERRSYKPLTERGHIEVPNRVTHRELLETLELRHLRVLLVLWGYAGYYGKREWLVFDRQEFYRLVVLKSNVATARWTSSSTMVGCPPRRS